VRWAIEDNISQCPFLQMTYTAENPHADGSSATGARPRYRPPRHRDLHATSCTHDNWMPARQTSCRQQTAPPQPPCSKDVTAHPHQPGARPGRPCPVPACSRQTPSGRSGFKLPIAEQKILLGAIVGPARSVLGVIAGLVGTCLFVFVFSSLSGCHVGGGFVAGRGS
jgi:hypothetical protein